MSNTFFQGGEKFCRGVPPGYAPVSEPEPGPKNLNVWSCSLKCVPAPQPWLKVHRGSSGMLCFGLRS